MLIEWGAEYSLATPQTLVLWEMPTDAIAEPPPPAGSTVVLRRRRR